MRNPSPLALTRQLDDIPVVGFDPALGALLHAHGGAPPAPVDALPSLSLAALGRAAWLRLPAWLRVGLARAAAPSRGVAALSLRGPFLLFLLGSLLALLATPGPLPAPTAPLSLMLGVLAYQGALRLACRGRSWMVAAIVVGAGLTLTPLWLGPQPLPYCKVTSFNAWAFALGRHLPSLGIPAINPNAIAGLLAVGLAFATAGALHARSRLRRLASGGGAVLLALCLVLTASRTGWLAGVAAVALVAASRGRRVALAVLSSASVALALLAASDSMLHSLSNLLARSELWSRTVALLLHEPISGLGLGRNAWALAGSGATAHNALLQLWSDAGLLGLASLAWAVARALRTRTALARRRLQPGWALVGLDGALAAFALQGLCETNTLFTCRLAGTHYLVISPLPFALLGLLAGLDAYSRRLAQIHPRLAARRHTPAPRPLTAAAPYPLAPLHLQRLTQGRRGVGNTVPRRQAAQAPRR
ncbi:MAG: O-antigen ligase family protein [Anaerolineae bacterium]